MAAPNSSPDLSIVNPERDSTAGPTPRASRPPAKGAPPATAPAPTKQRRRGVPVWLLIMVAVAGAVLVLVQYQRAERLGTQVASLQVELAEVGEQLGAYVDHLEQVRGGVADLSDRIGSLRALAERDPLSPPPAAPVPSQSTPLATRAVPDDAAYELPTILPSASEASPADSPEARRSEREIIGSALSTPLTGIDPLADQPL